MSAVAHAHLAHAAVAAVIIHPHVIRVMAMAHAHVTRLAVRAFRALAAAVSARRPKISVVTPTWQRRGLLVNRCIPSVRAQTYDGPVEHVIVSDGPDPALADVPGVRFLPEHREAANRGIWARLAGTRLAAGDLIAYLDDDNAWRPDHLEVLAAAITGQDVSFAYSRARCVRDDGLAWEIGCAPPCFGQIDTSLIMHRAGLLATAAWRPSGQPADWDITERWLEAGARWAFVPRITLDYYARSPVPALPGRSGRPE